jgi:hypothetical protein
MQLFHLLILNLSVSASLKPLPGLILLAWKSNQERWREQKELSEPRKQM